MKTRKQVFEVKGTIIKTIEESPAFYTTKEEIEKLKELITKLEVLNEM